MDCVKVNDRQCLFDIAAQKCGSIESVFDIAIQNDLSITDDLTVGQTIYIPSVANKNIATYFDEKGIEPATAITSEQQTELNL